MKKGIKKIVSVLLMASMILGCAGCDGSSEEVRENLKEFYYVPEHRKLEIEIDYVESSAVNGDTLYMYGTDWNEEDGTGNSKLYAYDLLSGELSTVPLELEGQPSVQKMFFNKAGNLVLMVQRYEETQITEEVFNAEESEESDWTEEVVVISDVPVAEPLYTEAVEYKEYKELIEISPTDGTILNCKDIQGVFGDNQYFYPQYITTDVDENIYVSDGNTSIFVMDASGNKLAEITLDDWVDSMFSSKEGNVYIKKWGAEGQAIYPVDAKTKTVGEAISANGLLGRGYQYNQQYYKGIDKGLLVSDSSCLFTYDFATDVATELFAWLDADVNSDNVEIAGQLSDGRFWALLHEYAENKTEYSVSLFTKTPAAEVQIKEELVYGTMWLGQDIKKEIIDFNKTNEKYRITVKEYQTGDVDYMTSLTQFNNDLTSGNCPDIINLNNIDFEKYASKGVFEDLYPYMEKEGIDKDDYLQNVLKAYEVGGKLYGVIPQFYVSSTAIKSSHVGDVTGWTLNEMLDVVKNTNAENIFQYGSRMSIFYYCVYNNMDEFINWETGECFFNSDEFIKVLEFASQFPEEPDYNAQDGEGISAKIRGDKLLLLETSISSVQEYQMMNGLFGEEITYIGYPNSERKGNLIQITDGSVSIAAKSDKKEAAWEFVKYFLSEEYQNELVSEHGGWGFPLKKSALEKQFEMDMTPSYYEDENGKQVENPKTSWGYDDFQIEIYAATKEEIEAVRKVLTSAEKTVTSINEELTNIISEETQSYFNGQKSAKDTADIIQNRIQIYVNENS